MRTVRTEDAVGSVLCHDVTQIIPGEKKGPLFKKGHKITAEDVAMLLSIGKKSLYVWEDVPGMIHEDDAAAELYALMAGGNMHPSGPSEAKPAGPYAPRGLWPPLSVSGSAGSGVL